MQATDRWESAQHPQKETARVTKKYRDSMRKVVNVSGRQTHRDGFGC